MITGTVRLAGSGSDREVKLDPDPASVRKARDFVAKHLPQLGLPPAAVDNAVLIASELVTNAVRCAPDTPCLLAIRVDAALHPVIEVHDSSAELPELQEPDFFSVGGRGLHVIDALCQSWECIPSGDGKAIIVTLPR